MGVIRDSAAPVAATVVFDGDCGFCTRCAEWLRSHLDADAHSDHGADIDVVPWQQTDLGALGLTHEDVAAAVWWVAPDEPPRRGAAAVAASLRACRRPWPVVGALLDARAMRPFARGAYALVARHRGRLGRWLG
jgi:predicted DCC family thiol-disulfide oxidoreductase YuxK